jgi:CRISPR/Cas system-associated exonuclease Cas4 (RecB family)
MNNPALHEVTRWHKRNIEIKNYKKLNKLDLISLNLSTSMLRITIQSLIDLNIPHEDIIKTIGLIIVDGVKNKEYKEYDHYILPLKRKIIELEEKIEKEILLSYDEEGNLLTPY